MRNTCIRKQRDFVILRLADDHAQAIGALEIGISIQDLLGRCHVAGGSFKPTGSSDGDCIDAVQETKETVALRLARAVRVILMIKATRQVQKPVYPPRETLC